MIPHLSIFFLARSSSIYLLPCSILIYLSIFFLARSSSIYLLPCSILIYLSSPSLSFSSYNSTRGLATDTFTFITISIFYLGLFLEGVSSITLPPGLEDSWDWEESFYPLVDIVHSSFLLSHYYPHSFPFHFWLLLPLLSPTLRSPGDKVPAQSEDHPQRPQT